jgi:hypothetical protein
MYVKCIILLCSIIIIVCILTGYKIETFINLDQTTVAIDIPKSPNDFLCYNYLKKIQKWDIDKYPSNIKRMILPMKTGFADRKSDIMINSPYNGKCFIPTESLNVLGISGEDCSIKDHTLEKTDDGCEINLRYGYSSEDKFNDLLKSMDDSFNDGYIKKIKELTALSKQLDIDTKKKESEEQSLDNQIINGENQLKENCDDSVIYQVRLEYPDNYTSVQISKLKLNNNSYVDYQDYFEKVGVYISGKTNWADEKYPSKTKNIKSMQETINKEIDRMKKLL